MHQEQAPDVANDQTMDRRKSDDTCCRLECDASHGLYLGPSAVLPIGASTGFPIRFVSVTRSDARSFRDLWSPPLAPPPRT